MKEKYDSYIKWAVTAMSVIVFGVTFFFLVFRLDALMIFFGKISSILFPVFFGAGIAYLLNPIVKFCNYYLQSFFRFCHMPVRISRFLAKALSITVSLGVLITSIVLLLSMVIPEFYGSLLKLTGDFRSYVNTIYDFVNVHLESNPEILSIVRDVLNSVTNFIYNWINNELILQVQTLMSGLTVGIIGIAKLLTNLVVSLIISIYLLISKDRFIGQLKKLLYVFLKPEKANVALSIFRQVNKIFGGFISGKIIDSAIIGVLCFIGLRILNMPYPLLISVIVGVTNVIPFFGPYIGAIPSAFLVLLIDPSKCLIFVIFILVLQQLDGNVIGPAILGDSTGLSPFWVVVSILVGGGLFGFLGMLLGVPTFAVIYYLFKTFTEYHLRKKNLPTASIAYCRIDHIDPENGKITFMKKERIKEESSQGLTEALEKIHFLSKKKKEEEKKEK